MKENLFRPTSDPREMRKILRELACGWVGGAPGVIRKVEIMARREGLSGEDEMTVLAYAALGMLEDSYRRDIERVMNTSAPPMVVVPSGGMLLDGQ